MSKEKLIIFDTTLRDGEQSPGAAMTKDEKLRIARALEKLRVDVIEAGFAASSPGDFDSVKSIAETIKDSTVCSLSRIMPRDIERSAEALKNAASGRIHTFVATSPIHMKYKLKMTPDEVVEQSVAAVKLARNLMEDVEFSLEDGSRTEFDFMCRITEAVIAAGARTINVPDTVGYGAPAEYGQTIGHLIRNVPNSDLAVFSVHCHNDLGLAVANSLAAVMEGARQVECTINGLGERAGNASLEEVVMGVKTRKDYYPVDTRIDTTQIVPTSRLVSSITGFPVQPNKAIVGANAFAHESGIHQDGVLKYRETYEIMKAEDVGWASNKLSLGKLSGRAAFSARLEEMGITFESKEELAEAFSRFKVLADKKRQIYDEDLQALISQVQTEHAEELYHFSKLAINSRTGEASHASLELKVNGSLITVESEGDGPVDAVFQAIEKVANSGCELKLFSINAVTEGTDSQGGVTVRLGKGDRIVNGHGSDTDIVVASTLAYLDALNILQDPARMKPKLSGV